MLRQNQAPTLPQLSSISPGNKPALSRQRDHSACRHLDTPLRVRKTRDNLKQCSIYTDIPPPCLHLHDQDSQSLCFSTVSAADEAVPAPGFPQSAGVATNELLRIQNSYQSNVSRSVQPMNSAPPAESQVQRQRSVKQRMLSRVKQGITNRTKNNQVFRPGESETSLVRRFSGRRKKIGETNSRAQSFEISRDSIDSQIDQSFDSAAGPVSMDRSFSGTSVSTANVLGDSTIQDDVHAHTSLTGYAPAEDGIGFYARTPSPQSSSPHPTPRPPPRTEPPALPSNHSRTISVAVPYIHLDVQMDLTTLDIHAKTGMWIAIGATVRVCHSALSLDTTSTESSAWQPNYSTEVHLRKPSTFKEYICGCITSLRICYKPMNGCRIRAILGQKSLKSLAIGQEAVLFIKLHVPRVRVANSVSDVADTDSLFVDLESMIGTLETEILHVEARYQNSLLPSDNVLAVRRVCALKRPRTESRWSMFTASDVVGVSTSVQTRLAEYLATQFPCDTALKLMHEHLDADILEQPSMRELRSALSGGSSQDASRCIDDDKPSVIVTDIDENLSPVGTDAADHFSTAPSTPVSYTAQQSWLSPSTHHAAPSIISLPLPNKLAPSLLSAAKTTTSLSQTGSQSPTCPPIPAFQTEDSARQLWRHIRRTSLSTKQLEEITPARVEHLEAGDETLKELRRKALSNKRSIGAETLKDWKWECNGEKGWVGGEAPWM